MTKQILENFEEAKRKYQESKIGREKKGGKKEKKNKGRVGFFGIFLPSVLTYIGTYVRNT